MKTYVPRENSLAGQVLAFLRNNPDEMLSAGDIVIKFDLVDLRDIYHRLRPAVTSGLLTRRVIDGVLVYMLADSAPEAAPDPVDLQQALHVAQGQARVLRDVLWMCIPWVQNAIGIDPGLVEGLGGDHAWPPAVVAEQAREVVRDFDQAAARDAAGRPASLADQRVYGAIAARYRHDQAAHTAGGTR